MSILNWVRSLFEVIRCVVVVILIYNDHWIYKLDFIEYQCGVFVCYKLCCPLIQYNTAYLQYKWGIEKVKVV